MKRVLAAIGLALVCAATLVGLSPTIPGAHAADKSFTLQSLVTDAVVQADGSMDVTEQWMYRFDGGPFNFGIRSFEKNTDQIGGFTAADNAGPLTVIAPADSVSGDWEWQLRQPTSDATVAFTISYRVSAALLVGSDVADLNWRFVGTEHNGIGSVDVTVHLPGQVPAATADVADADAGVLRAWAHGPANGTVTVTDSTIVASVTALSGGQLVEVRAAVPAGVFSSQGSDQLLPGILADELSIAVGAPEPDRRYLGWILTPILVALGALGTAALWFTSGREPKSREVLGEYWREPLTDSPAIVVATLGRGTAPAGPVIAATIVDLAQRGFLTITGEPQPRIGRDATLHRYHWAGKDTSGLLPFEQQVLELVFRGQVDSNSDEMTAWTTANRIEAKRQIDVIVADVRRLYNEAGYDAKVNAGRVGMLAAICLVTGLGSAIVGWVSKNGVAWIGVAAAFALLVGGARLLSNRSQAGAEAFAKADGLRNFLRDFSRLEDAPVGHLILWERFLVYSVALGVSAELMQGLAVREPQVLADPTFSPWYIGIGASRLGGFDQMSVHSAAVATAAVPPNTSGAGGGFSSGGSSFGGGGGGAGAR